MQTAFYPHVMIGEQGIQEQGRVKAEVAEVTPACKPTVGLSL